MNMHKDSVQDLDAKAGAAAAAVINHDHVNGDHANGDHVSGASLNGAHVNTAHAGGTQLISNDRDLLKALRMSDSEAAMFLGKSRQALNTQLGPKKGAKQPPPADYFKPSDILILISAARQMGRAFSVERVRDYVVDTRKPDDGDPDEPYKMLIDILSGGDAKEIDLKGADTLVFVLPSFAELRASRPEVAEGLRRMLARARNSGQPPSIFLLSSNGLQAKMAGQWLRIDDTRCFGSDVADHYLPTILTYSQRDDNPQPFVLTEGGSFVAAPRFLNHKVADCVRSLLPLKVSQELHSADDDMVEAKPLEAD